jgi:hypothetical protein
MITIADELENQITEEHSFSLFKINTLWCCVLRMSRTGCLNGYVAVPEGHNLYGKKHSDKVVVPKDKELAFNGNYIGLLCANHDEAEAGIFSLDMAIDVHCGLTFSEMQLYPIENDVLGKQWWFGFDTSHSGDMKPYQNDFDRKYRFSNSGTYRTFEYVKEQTISLALQLSQF